MNIYWRRRSEICTYKRPTTITIPNKLMLIRSCYKLSFTWMKSDILHIWGTHLRLFPGQVVYLIPPYYQQMSISEGLYHETGKLGSISIPRVRAHHTWQWQGDLTSPSGDNREKWEHLKETSIRNSGACPLKLLSQNKKCLVSLLFTIT